VFCIPANGSHLTDREFTDRVDGHTPCPILVGERQRDRERDRDSESQRETETETETETERDRHRDRQTDRQSV
jgi:hypothetical protein